MSGVRLSDEIVMHAASPEGLFGPESLCGIRAIDTPSGSLWLGEPGLVNCHVCRELQTNQSEARDA